MKKLLLTTALLSALTLSDRSAFAQMSTPIQMVPPTPVGSMATCPAGFQQLLSYSGTPEGGGQGGINCVPISTDAQGDLAANGYIQAGNSAASCNASLAGAIRFNPTTVAFEGCNGSSWQSLGTQSGTICGMQTNGSNFGPLCEGYSPYNFSCPPGYSPNWWLVSFGNDQFMFCVKD